jgi:small multidrug resistance family-3 protein
LHAKKSNVTYCSRKNNNDIVHQHASLLFPAMPALHTLGLFIITALAEILGCYLPYVWLKKGGSIWLLLPAAASLALFAWLLTLHPTASGRVYAAYGGVYIATALVWLWLVDGVRPSPSDWLGAALCLAGMAVIMFGPRPA